MTTPSTTDLVPYSLPDMGDIADAKDQAKSNNQWWRHAGKKSDYPGMTRYQFRAVPRRNGLESIRETYEHFFQLPNGAWIIEWCPIHMRLGKVCFYCELANKTLSNNPLDYELASKIQAKQVFIFNVILRHDEARGPVIHKSHWSWKKYADDQRKQGKNAFDPTAAGRDVLYQMPERDGERHEYKPMLDPSPLHVDQAQIDEWIGLTHDLRANSIPMTYQEQEEAYQKAVERTSFPGGGQVRAPAQSTTTVVQSAPAGVRTVAATVRRLPAAGSQDDSGGGLV